LPHNPESIFVGLAKKVKFGPPKKKGGPWVRGQRRGAPGGTPGSGGRATGGAEKKKKLRGLAVAGSPGGPGGRCDGR